MLMLLYVCWMCKIATNVPTLGDNNSMVCLLLVLVPKSGQEIMNAALIHNLESRKSYIYYVLIKLLFMWYILLRILFWPHFHLITHVCMLIIKLEPGHRQISFSILAILAVSTLIIIIIHGTYIALFTILKVGLQKNK